MGFLGTLRRLVSKNTKNGVLDAAAASEAITKEIKTTVVGGADISSFFSPKYLRNVNEVARLGETNLHDFVRFSREGNFEGSFGSAFPGNAAIHTPAVRNTLNNLLRESRRTLPDFDIAQRDAAVSAIGKNTGINLHSLRTEEELSKAVASNSKMNDAVAKLIKQSNSTGKIKLLGVTIAISVGTASAVMIYRKAVELAETATGCFAYWTAANGETRKCKLKQLSCRSPRTNNECSNIMFPITTTECTAEGNKKKACIHCDEKDPIMADIADNIVLRCEEKTAGDMLGEMITSTVGNVFDAARNIFGVLLRVGLIVLIVIIVLIVVVQMLR